MDSTFLQHELNEMVKNIQKAKDASLVSDQDLELKKLLVFDFFESLFEDETLQAEYLVQDIAMIVLVFWDKSDETAQIYSEKRIREVLTQPVEENHFIHFQEQFEGNRVLAYEFIIKAIYIALANNSLLKHAYEEVLEQARKESNTEEIISLPVRQRIAVGLEKVLAN